MDGWMASQVLYIYICLYVYGLLYRNGP
jgi:hypothetical protein